MTNKKFPHLVLFAFILLSFANLFAQDISPAAKAFQTWREKRVTPEMAAEGRFIGVAFAVSRSSGQNAKVDVAIGVGENIGNLGKANFIVQPLTARQDSHGKNIFENVGNASTLNFPELENVKSPNSDIIADPSMTVSIPIEAMVIKITVNTQSESFSVMLPLQNKTSTAILGGEVEVEAQRLKCQWYSR